jgi:hypothetical protein
MRMGGLIGKRSREVHGCMVVVLIVLR